MIKFSVITVCLNAGNDLLETISSTLSQTYENFEIIVNVVIRTFSSAIMRRMSAHFD